MKFETIPHKGQNLLLCLMAMMLLAACGGLPPLKTFHGTALSKTAPACRGAFPQGKWQFSHVISATLPGGTARLIGVTELSSGSGRIHAVMMTIEGLVLFDALLDGELTLNRSVAPFDSPEFARGLMDDIRLILLEPAAAAVDAGLTEDGFRVCRYRVSKDKVVDVMILSGNRIDIRKYEKGTLIRNVVIVSSNRSVPEKVTLTAYGSAGYELNLQLISAEPISR